MEQVIKGSWLFETYYGLVEFTARADKSALNATRDFVADQPNFTFPPGTETVSFDEALRLGRDGWSEELPEALAVAESAIEMAEKEHMTDSFNQPVWDVTGAQVDVGAFLAGTPECMIDYPLSETSKVGRVITLAVGTAISASISSDTYLRRGRCVVALALALSRLGHAVEIWAFDSSVCHGKGAGSNSAHLRVQVKSAHDEVDPAALMFALAHPATHRALMWAVRDRFPQPWKRGLSMASRRGMPNDQVCKTEQEMYPEGTIFLPGIRSGNDVPEAAEFLKKYLGELGLLAE